MISIITASYNYSKYISETIKSVLAQTYSDWELIIVDDCSTDNSLEVISQFKDERIKVYQNEKNLGLAQTLKYGVELAQGEWVAFLESDDAWKPETLQKRLEIAEKYPSVDFVFNDVELFGEKDVIEMKSKSFDRTRKYLKKLKFPRNIFYNFGKHNIIFTFSAFMVKKNKINENYFNSPSDKLLDWWFYINISQSSDAFYMSDTLTKWQMHDESYLNKGKKIHIFLSFEAYRNILGKDFSMKLLLYTMYVLIYQACITLTKICRIKIVRKIKNFLHLKLKKSPF